MNPALKTLLESAARGAIEERAHAVSQLAMLLEKNTRPSTEAGFYESILSPDLLEVALDVKQQRALLSRFAGLQQLLPLVPSLLWAAGKALPEAGMPVLLDLLRNRPELAPDAAYQALIALDNFLNGGSKGNKRFDPCDALRESHAMRFLRWAASVNDPKLTEHAERLLKKAVRKRGA
jgi:hypothetical protein